MNSVKDMGGNLTVRGDESGTEIRFKLPAIQKKTVSFV